MSDSLIVKLSISSSFQDQELEPYKGYQVYIIDENDVVVELDEIGDGKYMYLDSSFHAEIGISYKLNILTPDWHIVLNNVALSVEIAFSGKIA